MTALLCVASIATEQFVQMPPEKKMYPEPPLVSVVFSVVPVSRYTWPSLPTQAVCPVMAFVAHEFTTCGVGISVGVTLLPSMFVTAIPVTDVADQLPFGMYAVTSALATSTLSELDG